MIFMMHSIAVSSHHKEQGERGKRRYNENEHGRGGGEHPV